LDRSILWGDNITILWGIVNKIDIQPAIDILDELEYKGLRIWELKMLREEKHGVRKKYLDYLYKFTFGRKYLSHPSLWLLDRYAEAAAEDERFYEVIKNTNVSNIEDYLNRVAHFRAHRGRTEHESLLGALYSKDVYLFRWAFQEIKKKKISALYEDAFKSCRDSARSNWEICECLLSGETSFDEP
jgi:nucleoside diphosphate kinase